MIKLNLDTILDQKKIFAHILFLIIAFLIITYSSIESGGIIKIEDQFRTAALIFVYIETFIFLAQKIFKNNVVATTSKYFLKNILKRFLFFYLASFLSAMVITIIFRYFDYWIDGQNINEVVSNFFLFEFNNWLKPVLIGLTLGGIIFLYIQLLEALKKGRQLNEEKLIFQNETLRNQINPHFLFNSLNTLSSLVATKPDLAENFIIKFSGIYRYILENIKKDRVPLNTELDFVFDYFELHKIRDEDKILLRMDRTNADKFWIPPVSLQILVENAIKHNMATREKPLHISIYIKDNQIIVKNDLQKKAQQLASNKIGLKNLNERIRLISNKELIIEETSTDFTVKMPLLL